MDVTPSVIEGLSDRDAAIELLWLKGKLGDAERKWTDLFGARDGRAPPRTTERFGRAVLVLVELLWDLKANEQVVGEWADFGYALGELRNGTVPKFLAPSHAANRKIDPSGWWMVRCFLAMMVDVHKAGGSSIRNACAMVAKNHRVLIATYSTTSRSRSTSNHSGTLQTWYKKFIGHSVKEWKAQEFYNDRRAFYEQIDPSINTSNPNESGLQRALQILGSKVEQQGERANKEGWNPHC